ncbi:MAG: glycosyltransferase [Bacteroidales bacterium]|jgi:glycosyltransferase involved in cell wall biosynthesis|nr:glycosyltransferase [Bacteroidales bacterium]
MNIVFISLLGIDGIGGVQRSIINRANYLADEGNNVVIINDYGTDEYSEKINSKIQIITHFLTKKEVKPLYIFRKNIELIKRNKADVVFVPAGVTLKELLLPFFIPKNVKIINEIRGSYHAYMKPWTIKNDIKQQRVRKFLGYLYHYYFLLPFLLRFFYRVVLLTKEDKRLWKLPNAVVINNFNANKKEVYKHKEKICFAITVGRIHPEKGFKALIDIWKIVVCKNPDLILHIYGDGALKTTLEEYVLKENLQNNIFFMGKSFNMLAQYNTGSVFCTCTYTEGFSNVIIEAQNCGLPVISYNAPNGPGEIINHGKDGFLCPIGDLEQFADYILLLANDNDLLEKMSENAIENVKRFDEEKIMQQWQALIK